MSSGFSPRERFVRIARLPDAEIDLAEAALVIAAEDQPGLDPDPWMARLNELAARLRPRLEGVRDELDRLGLLSGFLASEVGLQGNDGDYYDPRNSYLNEVLDRGLGIPITMALVFIEIGRRVGIPLDGVGFPGHFLLRHSLHPQIVLDPFRGGRVLTQDDCREILERLSGGSMPFDPRLLRPAGPRQILARMLNNLRGIHLHRGDLERTLAALDRLLILDPDDGAALRDRGLLSIRQGDLPRAVEDLERYLDLDPEAADHDAIADLVAEARRQLGQVN
jgi:regulator of sirC expression with transglutaminase-like and TPR domain